MTGIRHELASFFTVAALISATWIAPRTSQAQSSSGLAAISVTFRAEPTELPSWVCALAKQTSLRPGPKAQLPTQAVEGSTEALLASALRTGAKQIKRLEPLDSTVCEYLEDLGIYRCVAKGNPPGASVALCAIATESAQGPSRLLVLEPSEALHVKNIRTDGNAAVIEVADPGRVVASLSALEGDYLRPPTVPLRFAKGVEPKVTLTLVPRASSTRLVLPSIDVEYLREGTLEITFTLDNKVLETSPLQDDLFAGRAAIAIPNDAPGTSIDRLHVLTMTIVGPAKPIVLSSNWRGQRPPEQLDLQLTSFGVQWNKHCLHEWNSCPVVKLAGSGTNCLPDSPQIKPCSYTCTTTSPASLPLPLDLAFETVPDAGQQDWVERWTDRFEHVGQTLTGFVAPEERHIALDTREVLAPDIRPGESVDAIEIRMPGGHRYSIEPTGDVTRVRIPGVRCTDSLTYQPVGPLAYKEGHFRADGSVTGAPEEPSPRETSAQKTLTKETQPKIENPEKLLRDVATPLALFSGGLQTPVRGRNVRGESCGADCSVGGKPRFVGLIEVGMVLHSGAKWWSDLRWAPNFELRIGIGLTQLSWRSFAGGSESESNPSGSPALEETSGNVWLLRMPLMLAVHIRPVRRLDLRIGSGAVWSTALHASEREFVPEQQWNALLYGSIGVPITDGVSTELAMRIIFPQQIVKYELPRGDYRGSQELHHVSGEMYLFTAGLRFERIAFW